MVTTEPTSAPSAAPAEAPQIPTAEEAAEAARKLLEDNQKALSASQEAAVAWMKENQGIGLCLGMDPSGTVHTWVVGNAQKLLDHEPTIDSQLFNLMLLLVGSHLPGSSAAALAMHQDLAVRADRIEQKLGVVLHNLGTMISFLQLKFPELRVQTVRMGGANGNGSGLIVP